VCSSKVLRDTIETSPGNGNRETGQTSFLKIVKFLVAFQKKITVFVPYLR